MLVAILLLYSVNCGDPLSLITEKILTSNGAVSVLGYSHPAMEETSVNFMCSPNHVLFGPHAVTCMGNGEWEPDPREVKCKGEKLNYV